MCMHVPHYYCFGKGIDRATHLLFLEYYDDQDRNKWKKKRDHCILYTREHAWFVLCTLW